MARIIVENLKASISRGQVDAGVLRYALAYEMNNANILTLATVGAGSAELNNRESQARQNLNALEADAAVNIPILQALLAEMNADATINTCNKCQKYHPGSGNVCSNCYQPSEY